MAEFLKRWKSLADERRETLCTVSIASHQRRTPSDQATKFDEETFTPIIAPLDTVNQVLSWEAGGDELCVASTPLRLQNIGRGGNLMGRTSTQKMIVCHDMMGGYTKDRFTQGISDLEDYYFYHWQHIGAFIYFSHHLITIPPPCWTNVAHRHGVLSMGTFITEWEDGAKRCFTLLQNESKLSQFAQQLVRIAEYYGFDGWLINIENPIHPMLLDQLNMFLSLVTTGMHEAVPGSKVIWYDSVTTEGKLKWQNELNQLNQPYFDTCDGIFLNYNWTMAGLASSAALAGERKGEVYVGIDVFGRGCPGGGGYNSCEALKSIHESGLSSALFAPGWVYETLDKQSFFDNQTRFWSLLKPWLPVIPITSLPLVSSFGRGCGTKVAIDGKIVYCGNWTNHSAQDLQPSFATGSSLSIQNDAEGAVELQCARLDLDNVYNNGASLLVKGRVKETTKVMTRPSILRLFKTKLSLSTPLVVSFTHKLGTKPISQGYHYFIQLHTTGSPTRIFLDPLSTNEEESEEEEVLLEGYDFPKSRGLSTFPGRVLAPLSQRHSVLLHQISTGKTQQRQTWKTSYFVIDGAELQDRFVQEITLGFYATGKHTNSEFSLNIGQIRVIDSQHWSPKSDISFISNVWCHDYKFSSDGQSVSFTLSWEPISTPCDPIDHCNIYLSSVIMEGDIVADGSPQAAPHWKSDYVFLGRSYAKTCYRVMNLYLLGPGKGEQQAGGCVILFEFRVQSVLASHCKLSVNDCPYVQVNFKQ